MNNAAVNFNQGSDNSVEHAAQVCTTNYYGTKNMIQALIPLMKHSSAGARIVNVSSRLGRLNGKRNVSETDCFVCCFLILVRLCYHIWLCICSHMNSSFWMSVESGVRRSIGNDVLLVGMNRYITNTFQ